MTSDAVETFENAPLQAALESTDVELAAQALLETGVLLARIEVKPGDRRVMVATRSDDERTLVAFTSATSALAWGEEELAVAVILGPDLLEVLAEQEVGNLVIDPAGPAPVALTVAQLRSMLAEPARRTSPSLGTEAGGFGGRDGGPAALPDRPL